MVSGIPGTVRSDPSPEFVRATSIKVGKQEVPGFFVTSGTFRKLDAAASSTTSWAREVEALRASVEKLEVALGAKKTENRELELQRDEYRKAWLAAEKDAVEARKCGLGALAPIGWGGLGFLAGAATCATVSWTLPR
jgi:hypothetical protein